MFMITVCFFNKLLLRTHHTQHQPRPSTFFFLLRPLWRTTKKAGENCGEIASPSPLKSLHGRVSLPGWTSPLSPIFGEPKRQSQYVFGCR